MVNPTKIRNKLLRKYILNMRIEKKIALYINKNIKKWSKNYFNLNVKIVTTILQFQYYKNINLTPIKYLFSSIKPPSLENVDFLLKNNKKVVKAAVSIRGDNLLFASDTLKSDYDIVLLAVSNNGNALQYVSEYLKSDYNIVIISVFKNGEAFL